MVFVSTASSKAPQLQRERAGWNTSSTLWIWCGKVQIIGYGIWLPSPPDTESRSNHAGSPGCIGKSCSLVIDDVEIQTMVTFGVGSILGDWIVG